MNSERTPLERLVYRFQHYTLRTGAKQSHPEFRAAMAADTPAMRSMHLYNFWAKAVAMAPPGMLAGVAEKEIGQFGLKYCSSIEVIRQGSGADNLDCLIFPPPRLATDAFFVAVATPIAHAATYPDESDEVRYFTLERSVVSPWTFCEWKASKHWNYGGCAASAGSMRAFLDMVDAELMGRARRPAF